VVTVSSAKAPMAIHEEHCRVGWKWRISILSTVELSACTTGAVVSGSDRIQPLHPTAAVRITPIHARKRHIVPK
jgi:hypothetical protein